jgi:hypothetical protein
MSKNRNQLKTESEGWTGFICHPTDNQQTANLSYSRLFTAQDGAEFLQAIQGQLTSGWFGIDLVDKTHFWNQRVSPSSVKLTIWYVSGVIIDQMLSNGLRTPVGIGHWEGGPDFRSYDVPATLQFPVPSMQCLRGDQGIRSGEKYYNWSQGNDLLQDVTNHHEFNIAVGFPGSLTSRFNPTVMGPSIKVDLIEAPGNYSGTVSFNDPWLIDYPDPSYGYKKRSQGMAAPFKNRTAPFSPDLSSSYSGDTVKGLFLNQPIESGKPYYSVGAPLTQTLSGTYAGYFQSWSASSAAVQNGLATQTPVVFGNTSAVVTANYKGIHLSNNASTWSDNSQRHFVQTPDGWLHMIYESMGHIYYENKAPGGNWQIVPRYGNLYQDDVSSKSPCIEYHCVETFGTMVIVAFQTANNIVLRTFMFQNGQYYDWGTPIPIYTNEALTNSINPNIAFLRTGEFMAIWEGKSNPGIHYWFGRLSSDWTNIEYITSGLIPETDVNSVFAAISTDKSDLSRGFDVAWEQDVPPSSASVRFINLFYLSGVIILTPSTPMTVSNPAFRYATNPTTISITDGQGDWISRIAWRARIYIPPVCRIYLCDPWYSQNWVYVSSSYQTSPSLNKIDDNSGFSFAWSLGRYFPEVIYFVNSSNLGQVKTLNILGGDIQLCNGSSINNMFVTAYNHFTLPYTFVETNSLGSFGKVTAGPMFAGRGLSLSKDGVGFEYFLGGMSVDGNRVDFVEAMDSVHYNTLDVINRVLISEPFRLGDKSEFVFTEDSQVGDSSAAAGVLGERGYVSFKVELVDVATGKVIGMIKKSRFTSSELQSHDMTVYSMSAAGLRDKVATVKITVETNIDRPRVALAEYYADEGAISKLNIEELTLQGTGIPKEYLLEQNYPNPWNPSTAIRYALPQKSDVSLAVYTSLGQLVRQLVNGEQEGGYYDVVFHADGLASGVYFYRLQAGNFVATKKLLLLK